ncbi:MAG: CYTH domain-containing protein [Candidatus Taylorbacteria bacterium]
MGHQYEIEIKTLLGEKKNADDFRAKLEAKGAVPGKKGRQLNHYFVGRDLSSFRDRLFPFIESDKKSLFTDIVTRAKDFSIRTRQTDDTLLLVVKASVGEGSSANAVSRMEFESVILDKTLDELDKIILVSGLEYQAKWSREREEFTVGDITVCLDRNAGYGYLAEFEKVVDDEKKKDSVRSNLELLMKELGVEELKQDRLERMFSHYNRNWRDYYGTDKVFNIE